MLKISEFKNKILKGDSIEILKKIPSNSINVIFADPPYFMQTEGELKRTDGTNFSGVNDEWDKFDSYEVYDDFTRQYLTECKRVLKKDGSIWVIGSYHNLFRMGYIMQNLGFWILNDVVWAKSNPTPNFRGTKFVNQTETMIWGTKTQKSKYTFNYKTMKAINSGKQMKSVWTLPISSGKERLKGQDGKKLHNTQKPEKLLELVILSSSKPSDIILDPFFGTGTTGAVAKRFKRNFVGIEREEEYIKAAEKRIDLVNPESNEYIEATLDIKKTLVPIKTLIDTGYITNRFLFDSKGTNKTTLLKNGKVKIEGNEYSIHIGSGKRLNKDNHNGWSYWYIKTKNGLKSIDEIREKYRENEL